MTAPAPARPTVVAIPAKNEAAHIRGCLEALAGQHDDRDRPLPPGAFGVLLLLNDCDDDTAGIATGTDWPFDLRLVCCRLPAAERHAGGARRRAMDEAAHWLEADGAADGMILTTDADTRPAADWIARQWHHVAGGAGAVAGRFEIDAGEHAALPAALRRRERLERRYGRLLDELDALLDPVGHDPWPCHRAMAGASIGVTLAAYRAVGGLPPVSSGEDRALGLLLACHGIPVRHAPDVRVTTSGRLDGRAVGGMAHTLSHRLADPASPCDALLEAALAAAHRAFWRARLRERYDGKGLDVVEDWAEPLGLDPSLAAAIARLQPFGRLWSALEWASPVLARRPIDPEALPREFARARRLLAWLRANGAIALDSPAALSA